MSPEDSTYAMGRLRWSKWEMTGRGLRRRKRRLANTMKVRKKIRRGFLQVRLRTRRGRGGQNIMLVCFFCLFMDQPVCNPRLRLQIWLDDRDNRADIIVHLGSTAKGTADLFQQHHGLCLSG